MALKFEIMTTKTEICTNSVSFFTHLSPFGGCFWMQTGAKGCLYKQCGTGNCEVYNPTLLYMVANNFLMVGSKNWLCQIAELFSSFNLFESEGV